MKMKNAKSFILQSFLFIGSSFLSSCVALESNDSKHNENLRHNRRGLQDGLITSNNNCPIPKLDGKWSGYSEYPVPVGESQGALIGDIFVQFSGFSTGYKRLTRKVYALNLKSPNGKWMEQDEFPIADGLTHAAVASDGISKVYICGGYIGASKGIATTDCYVFNYNNPKGTQFVKLQSLPGARGGGALWYDKDSYSLIFSGGASRPLDPAKRSDSTDHTDTWQLSLKDQNEGWKARANVPYKGNHVGHTTVNQGGVERHFILGGQLVENEPTGNRDDVYEFVPKSNTWIQHTKMPFPRGHFSESTIPYKGCGFIIVAGSINGKPGRHTRTDDISYYDLATQKWTSIGQYPAKQATPVCEMYDGYIYCQTGHVNEKFAARIKVI